MCEEGTLCAQRAWSLENKGPTVCAEPNASGMSGRQWLSKQEGPLVVRPSILEAR